MTPVERMAKAIADSQNITTPPDADGNMQRTDVYYPVTDWHRAAARAALAAILEPTDEMGAAAAADPATGAINSLLSIAGAHGETLPADFMRPGNSCIHRWWRAMVTAALNESGGDGARMSR